MAVVEVRWEWVLQGSPRALWHWVSDTDFTNRAAGMESVSYRWEALPDGGRRRLADSRLGPLKNRWVEHPYEWVENERFGVRRDFVGGPLRSYSSQVALEPVGHDSTRLVHTISLEPRLGIASPALRLLMAGMKSGWNKAYQAAEAAAKLDTSEEALGAPHQGMLAALVAQGVESSLARRLAAYVLHAPPRQAEHMRPFTLADAWGTDRSELLGACYAAARTGFLEPRWALRCPHCLGPKGISSRLANLSAEASCEDCQATFGARLDRNAELAFRPVAQVRAHLSAIFCMAGPAASKHIVSQGALGKGESVRIELAVAGGPYRLRTGTKPIADLTYDPDQAAGLTPSVELASEGLQGLTVGGDRLCLTLTHSGAGLLPYALESVQGREAACPVAVAIAHPDFTGTFPGDGLAPQPSYELDAMVVLAWRGANLGLSVAKLHCAIQAKGPQEEPLWGYLDPVEALRAALNLHDPKVAFALHMGPVTMTGQVEGHPELAGTTVDQCLAMLKAAPDGALVLSPGLAMEGHLRSQLLVEGWGEGETQADRSLLFRAESLQAAAS